MEELRYVWCTLMTMDSVKIYVNHITHCICLEQKICGRMDGNVQLVIFFGVLNQDLCFWIVNFFCVLWIFHGCMLFCSGMSSVCINCHSVCDWSRYYFLVQLQITWCRQCRSRFYSTCHWCSCWRGIVLILLY